MNSFSSIPYFTKFYHCTFVNKALGFASLIGTFLLSPKEDTLTIALINICIPNMQMFLVSMLIYEYKSIFSVMH